mgnify:CR=1 FL=1
MAAPLEELNNTLTQDIQTDYWSDEVSDQVALLLNQFEEPDWQLLAQVWSKKPEEWQIKLAEALSGCDPFDQASNLLITMLRSKSKQLKIAAVESLEGRDDVFVPTIEIKNDLENLLDQVTEPEKFEIRNLLNKIS